VKDKTLKSRKAEKLKSDPTTSQFRHHAREDCEQFIGFAQ
jgi:hypothetical protein